MAEWKFGDCLVTGGAGFLGKHLTKALLDNYEDIKIKVLSRDENQMASALASWQGDKRVTPIIGDIQDVGTLEYALIGVDAVIHLAAMKHIDFCEENPMETVDTNVLATMNLLNLFDGKIFVGMSTDKAAEARGCYGATKLLLEKLILEQAKHHANRRYMVIRSGNIFGSTGSVIPKWLYQLKAENKIYVTDLMMTRFFIDVNTLASFIITKIENGDSGKIYIPHQPTVKLNDLADAFRLLYGNEETKLEIIGLRKSEKMHERMYFTSEKDVVVNLGVETSEHGKHLGVAELKKWLGKLA
jgi:UDP-N-acetylglucosamine 4,6-dehydratase